MWTCDRKLRTGPMTHVLNGDYPKKAVEKMNLYRLERLVWRLVQCTSEVSDTKRSLKKPVWWPKEVTFNHPVDLGRLNQQDVRPILIQLIADCTRFFKNYENTKWRNKWNNENRKRKMEATPNGPSRKRLKTLQELPPEPTQQPFKLLEDIPKQPLLRLHVPNKDDFLHYFRLENKVKVDGATSKLSSTIGGSKLVNCTHIPLSSDIGKLLIAKENHKLPEELKLRRLEKIERYTNTVSPKVTQIEYECGPYKKVGYYHNYTMPKRQNHQKRQSLNNVEFLKQFCKQVVVKVEKVDLKKLQDEYEKDQKSLAVLIKSSDNNKKKQKKLVVLIKCSEKLNCDLANKI